MKKQSLFRYITNVLTQTRNPRQLPYYIFLAISFCTVVFLSLSDIYNLRDYHWNVAFIKVSLNFFILFSLYMLFDLFLQYYSYYKDYEYKKTDIPDTIEELQEKTTAELCQYIKQIETQIRHIERITPIRLAI